MATENRAIIRFLPLLFFCCLISSFLITLTTHLPSLTPQKQGAQFSDTISIVSGSTRTHMHTHPHTYTRTHTYTCTHTELNLDFMYKQKHLKLVFFPLLF